MSASVFSGPRDGRSVSMWAVDILKDLVENMCFNSACLCCCLCYCLGCARTIDCVRSIRHHSVLRTTSGLNGLTPVCMQVDQNPARIAEPLVND